MWLALRTAPDVPEKVPSGTFIFLEAQRLPPPPPKSAAPVRPQTRSTKIAARQPTLPKSPPQDDAPKVAIETRKPPLPNEWNHKAVVLLSSSTYSLTLDAGAGAASTQMPTLSAPRQAEAMLAKMAQQTVGEGRVDRGLVHSYYGQLGKALIKQWDADRVARRGLKGFGEQLSANSKIYNELWAERAAAFGRSGSPLANETVSSSRRAPGNERIQGLPGVDLEARKELSREMARAFRATRAATFRVVQDTTGRLLSVELVQPSNDSQVDKEALKDVRAAAQRLPPPPDEVIAGRDHLTSLWSFELIVSISPPVPVFTFEFDEALGFVDARLPLDRRIYKKVRLVSVE